MNGSIANRTAQQDLDEYSRALRELMTPQGPAWRERLRLRALETVQQQQQQGMPMAMPGAGAGADLPITPIGQPPGQASTGILANLPEAAGESAIAANAQFLQSPLGQRFLQFLDASGLSQLTVGRPLSVAPEFLQQARDEARESSAAAIQRMGGDWSVARGVGHLAAGLGEMASPQGILGMAVGGAVAPIAGAGLAARGAGPIARILGEELASGVASGAAMQVAGDTLHRDDGSLTPAGEMLQQLGWDIASSLGMGGGRLAWRAYRYAGKPGFQAWYRTLGEGVDPYRVDFSLRQQANLDEPLSLTFGRGQFDIITHADAWEPILRGAGVTAEEATALRNGVIPAGVEEKVNGFLQSNEGRAIVDALDRGYAESLWTHAAKQLSDAGVGSGPRVAGISWDGLDPRTVAQVADAAHSLGLRENVDVRVMRDANGRITSDSIAEWRATRSAEEAERAARLAQSFDNSWLPWRKTYVDPLKGITVADADAALARARTRVARGGALDPRANEDVKAQVAAMDAEIDRLLRESPEAAGALMAERRALVERVNAETAERMVKLQELEGVLGNAMAERQQAIQAEYENFVREQAELEAQAAREAEEMAEAEALLAERKAEAAQAQERLREIQDEVARLEAMERTEAEERALEEALKEERRAEAEFQSLRKEVLKQERSFRAKVRELERNAGKRNPTEGWVQDFDSPVDMAEGNQGLVSESGGVEAPSPWSAESLSPLLPDVPPELIDALVNHTLVPGKRMPKDLNDALVEVFNSLGGADALGPYIKWRNKLEKRVLAAIEASTSPDPLTAMREAEAAIERAAQRPQTPVARAKYDAENVTILGEEMPWKEFRTSAVANELTSKEFVSGVARRGNLSEEATVALQNAANEALSDPLLFHNYIRLVESHLGPDVSLTLPPEQFALTRALADTIKALESRLVEAGYPANYFKSKEFFARALSRYFAMEINFGRMTPEDISRLLSMLQVYEEGYRAGKLTPEIQNAVFGTFAELIDNVRIHENMGSLPEGVVGVYDPARGRIDLAARGMLDSAVHEILHAFVMQTDVGRELLRQVDAVVGAEDRVALARLVGADMSDPTYAMDTLETAVRLVQAYMGDAVEFSRLRPELADVAEKMMEKLSDEQRRLFTFFSHVQKATAAIHQRGDYQYPWLAEVYGEGNRPFDYIKSFSEAMPEEWRAAYELEKGRFSQTWLRAGNWVFPTEEQSFTFLMDTLAVLDLARYEQMLQPSPMPQASQVVYKRIPEPLLAPVGEAMSASADTALRVTATEEAARKASRALHWFGNLARLAPVEVRANWLRESENGIVQAVEPHITKAFTLANELYKNLNAASYRYISGPQGILEQPWVKDFTRGVAGNAKEALRAFLKGEARLANPSDNAGMTRLAKESWERGRWLTGAEIDAAEDLSASGKEAFKYITAQTIERSNAMKQALVENYLASQPELAEYRGKGMGIKELKETGKLSKEQIRELNLIDDIFRPGYYPTTRLGDFRVYVRDASGEIVYATGAATKREADAKAARLRQQFPDALSPEVKRVPELPPLANQLDASGSVVAQMLHYLQDTEHGAAITLEDIEAVLRRMQQPGELQKYFAKRRNVPGWEEEDFLARHMEFLQRSAFFEHGQMFKRGIQELIATGGLTARQVDDITALFNNTMNNRSKWETALVGAFETIAPDLRHFRHYAQTLRKLAYNFTLGFSSVKRVALETLDFLTVNLNTLSGDIGKINAAYGKNAPFGYALRQGMLGAKDAATWLLGLDHDNPIFKAFQQAEKMGFIQPSPVRGEGLMKFLSQRRIGLTPGESALDTVLERLDILGHATTAMREMATFSAFYRAYRELFPTMTEDAVLAFAAERTMMTQYIRPANRPTIDGFQGEVANQFLTFKSFLINQIAKIVENVKLAKGDWFHVPNPEWKPGSSAEKFIPVHHKDAGNMLKYLASVTAIGGTLGIPGVGWVIRLWNEWTGNDETLKWKKEIEKLIPGEGGRFIGAMVDKGLLAEYAGWDVSDLGNLLLPQPRDGWAATIAPAALSIIGQRAAQAYDAAFHPDAMEDRGLQLLRAVSPNFWRNFIDLGQLLANKGRVYTPDGRLIGDASPGDMVKLALGGMAPLRDEEYRKAQVDQAQREKRSQHLTRVANRIATKIARGEELEPSDLAVMWSDPAMWPRVKAVLKKTTIPTYATVLQSIMNSNDPVLAELRWRYYQSLWQDAMEEEEEE